MMLQDNLFMMEWDLEGWLKTKKHYSKIVSSVSHCYITAKLLCLLRYILLTFCKNYLLIKDKFSSLQCTLTEMPYQMSHII